MGQQHSMPSPERPPYRGRQVNWWEALKLGSLTAAVAALQWFRYALLAIEDNRERDRHGHRRTHSYQGVERGEKGFVAGMSPETRRALVNLIDYQLTPVLVDQWRVGLVKVLLDPAEGPVLPDEDPHVRQAILDSIKSYQEAEDRRPTFREGSAPARYTEQQQTHPRNQQQPRDYQTEAGPSGRSQAAPLPRNPTQSKESAVNAVPSAPPLYPEIDPPSAPPLIAEEPGPSFQEPAEPIAEDCGICMDARVEVEIEGCHHQLCCECAKAICCLEGRAPQCPFCRGPMQGVRAIQC